MLKRLGPDGHSLLARMVLSFITPVLLTAVAIGLPSIYLIHDQLERQAWAQVEQGRRATQALYEAEQSRVSQRATLTAERPTLRELLADGEQAALLAYLQTLQSGARLDVMLICDSAQRPVVCTVDSAADALCAASVTGGFYTVATDLTRPVWLLAAQPISDAAGGGQVGSLGSVVVGIVLNENFARQMRAQTGLEHTLLVDSTPVATSLAGRDAAHDVSQPVRAAASDDITLRVDDFPYYAARFPLNESGLAAEVALAVADIVATQRRLAWTMAAGTLIVAAIGSGVGALLARRIDRPLTRLAGAATALSKGDLSRPVAVESSVREVTLVAQALENARVDWQHTLDQLRQEKAWTDHLLEAIIEGIVTLDRQGRITFFSRGAERITGWTRDQVIGRSLDRVFRPMETGQIASQLIPAPGRGHKVSVELRDGRQAVLAVTGARLLPPEGGEARVALVFRDVSEEEAVHRLLGHFLANVAHEFRTPLSALAASVELLLDQASDLSSAELQELLNSLHLGVLGLQTLVDNLLESASIEAGHFQVSPRPSNLSEIIAEAINTLQPLLNKRGQHLAVALPATIPVVWADPRRTVQVLVNLLSNASKYGPDEAEITIGAAVSEDLVKVTVADRGPGIPLEHHEAMFRRFTRLGISNGKAQYGAGLGLSVVKAIVRAHGGQVGLDDRPGGGAVFWFTLPEITGR